MYLEANLPRVEPQYRTQENYFILKLLNHTAIKEQAKAIILFNKQFAREVGRI
jgi:hypothetical protein